MRITQAFMHLAWWKTHRLDLGRPSFSSRAWVFLSIMLMSIYKERRRYSSDSYNKNCLYSCISCYVRTSLVYPFYNMMSIEMEDSYCPANYEKNAPFQHPYLPLMVTVVRPAKQPAEWARTVQQRFSCSIFVCRAGTAAEVEVCRCRRFPNRQGEG